MNLNPAVASTDPANRPTPQRADVAGPVDGVAAARGSGPVTPGAPDPGPPPSGSGAPVFNASAPAFWGHAGCRFAGRPDHVCRTSFGMALEPGQVCFSEARVSLLEMMDSYRAVGQ